MEGKTELASAKVGGQILFTTDDFFAVGENMISYEDPVWDAQRYTDCGKWMDGWETRRKRVAGHDWCLLKLGLSGVIQGIEFDTAFFTGNQTPQASVQAACFDEAHSPKLVRRSQMGTKATEQELKEAEAVGSDKWETILPMSKLKPGYPETRHNVFKIESTKRWTHLRINMFPDGGIARLRVYGSVSKDFSKIPSDQLIDLAAVENGGTVVSFTDAHYGHPRNLIMPGRGVEMYDGWETARNPNRPPVFVHGEDGHLIIPGSHHTLLKLGTKGTVDNIQVDTAYFRGNYPESCTVEGCFCVDESALKEADWFPLLPRTKLTAHAQHDYDKTALAPGATSRPVTHVRLTMYPDGGISRLRVNGFIVKS